MTIRKTLLLAFLGLGLGTSILLTALAFVKAREALRAEIDRNVLGAAESLSGEIDKAMFERLQNAAVWSRLDVMQDLDIRDIDKRLSQFLADLQHGYRDVYLRLDALGTDRRIVASSDPAFIGREANAASPWLATMLSGATLTLSLDRGAAPRIGIEAPIASSATKANIGALRLALDGADLDRLLDRAAADGGRAILVVDADGRAIAASRRLRARPIAALDRLAEWTSSAHDVAEHDATPILDGRVIVGTSHSRGYAQFAGFGWTVLVIQPVAEALAPVHRMGAVFLVLLCAIALLTTLIALWISRALARPIVALTRFVRDPARRRAAARPPTSGVGEVGELGIAFADMMKEIDLSQRKLVTASKFAVIGEMSSVIAHEVRTPLGIMRSSAQLLEREAGISEEGRELAGFIGSETDRLNRLVSAMLDSARPRAPGCAPVDMHALVSRAAALLGAQLARRRIDVTLVLEAEDAIVECDEEQITQVILNILMNALQILREGGRIEVTTRDAGLALAIDIADDGPGIPPQERDHVFEAFFFKREGGLGLGLAIVQRIVQAHGGSIEVDQSAHAGALFRILLPRRRGGEA